MRGQRFATIRFFQICKLSCNAIEPAIRAKFGHVVVMCWLARQRIGCLVRLLGPINRPAPRTGQYGEAIGSGDVLDADLHLATRQSRAANVVVSYRRSALLVPAKINSTRRQSLVIITMHRENSGNWRGLHTMRQGRANAPRMAVDSESRPMKTIIRRSHMRQGERG